MGNRSKLPPQAQLIGVVPEFHDPTGNDLGYLHHGNINPLPSWGDTSKLTFVGSSEGTTKDYLVSLGNHVLNSLMAIGEGSENYSDVLFKPLQRHVTRGSMSNRFRGKRLLTT